MNKLKYISAISTLFLVSSCGALPIGRDYQTPNTGDILNKSFNLRQEEKAKSKFADAKPVAAWWTNFEDDFLNKLVEDALKHNHDIKIAKANLQAARLFVDESNLGYFPTVTGVGDYTDVMSSRQANAFSPPQRRHSTYETAFDAFWELDLFGKVSGQVDKAEADANSLEAQLQGAYVTIAAEVARGYIELRGAQSRLDIAEKNASNQKKTYQLTQDLLDAGQGNRLDVERARANLQLTKATIPTLQAQINANLNRLGVLTGKTPDSLHASLEIAKPLPSIPVTVNIGNPTELIKRRPDVKQAESDLQSAVADYNINVANLYPDVSFNGSVGFIATTLSGLGTAGTSTLLMSPTINWAAFNIGRVNTQIDQADAITKAKLANFEKSVLVALEEVDTSMVNFTREEQRRANLLQAAKASANAEELAQDRFDAGIDSFIDKLDAQRTLLDAQDKLAQSETSVALNLVAMYKALGGGWEVVEGKEINTGVKTRPLNELVKVSPKAEVKPAPKADVKTKAEKGEKITPAVKSLSKKDANESTVTPAPVTKLEKVELKPVEETIGQDADAKKEE